MTKQLKKSVRHKKRFLTEIVTNGLNHSKLAAKQPKRPSFTKAENRSKTLKKAKKNENCLKLVNRMKKSKHFFSYKKIFLTKQL